MSRINFSDLIRERPDLRDVWDRFRDWRLTHPSASVIDPRRVAKFATGIPPDRLVEALFVLVDRGYLKHVYQVEDPGGALTGQDFRSPLEIPDYLTDRDDVLFDTSNGSVVSVFRETNCPERR